MFSLFKKTSLFDKITKGMKIPAGAVSAKEAKSIEKTSIAVAEHFISFKDAFDKTASITKPEIAPKDFWSDVYILGILAGFTERYLLYYAADVKLNYIAMAVSGTILLINEKNGDFQNLNWDHFVIKTLCAYYKAPNERFKLALNRAFNFLLYLHDEKDFKSNQDFIDVRALIISQHASAEYRAMMGPQWANLDEKTKVVSVFMSNKLVIEALNSFKV